MSVTQTGGVPVGAFDSPVVDSILRAASALLGTEVVFIGLLDEENFTFARLLGDWQGYGSGDQMPVADSLCSRLLSSREWGTGDAVHSEVFGDAPSVTSGLIQSYVGVPVMRGDGSVIATLCGMDSRPGLDSGASGAQESTRSVLSQLGNVLAQHIDSSGDAGVVIRRGERGWTVAGDGDPADELTTAMVLADLLTADIPAPARPPRAEQAVEGEVERLQRSVRQLEHALAARVVVEQAIGALSERLGVPPRESFETLRRVARSQGRKVVDLARLVVATATIPDQSLPPELTRR